MADWGVEKTIVLEVTCVTFTGLRSYSSGSITALWHPSGTGLRLAGDRVLSKDLTGSISFSAGITQGCSVSLTRNLENNQKVTAELKVYSQLTT